jgi:urease subunit alpha
MADLTRKQYADLYGPSVGDKFKLADTELVCEIEKDYRVPGEEVVFGGGKTIREGMGQSTQTNKNGALDLVITNVIIIDRGPGCSNRRYWSQRW